MSAMIFRNCTVISCCLALTSIASAQQPTSPLLRVETKVSVIKPRPQEIGQMLTLFENGLIYDIQMPSQQDITVYDIARQRIVLIDRAGNHKTTLQCDNLIQFMTDLRAEAIRWQRGGDLGLNVIPVFQPDSGVFRAGFPGMLYIVESQALKSPQLSAMYNEFTMWATRLNTFQRSVPGAPFMRLALTQKMSETRRVPRSVRRQETRGNAVTVIESKHDYMQAIGDEDRQLIDDIKMLLVTCKEITHKDFQQQRIANLSK